MVFRRSIALLVGLAAAISAAVLLVPPLIYLNWQHSVAAYGSDRWTTQQLLTAAGHREVSGLAVFGAQDAIAADNHGLDHAVRLGPAQDVTVQTLKSEGVRIVDHPDPQGWRLWLLLLVPIIPLFVVVGVVAVGVYWMLTRVGQITT